MHSSQKYFQKNNFENIFKKILKKKRRNALSTEKF
jgi:hypothetical protein